jgi:hypothetical protein
MKPINTLCGKNADLIIVKEGGIYIVTTGFKELKYRLKRTRLLEKVKNKFLLS